MAIGRFIGAGATAKASLLNSKHSKFTGFESDSNCLRKMRTSRLETFAGQVLNKNSEIFELDEEGNSSRIFVERAAKRKVVRETDKWRLSRGRVAVPARPTPFFQVISQYYYDMGSFENASHISSTVWLERWKSCLNVNDASTLLGDECGICGVVINN